jgi:hypothetical protein
VIARRIYVASSWRNTYQPYVVGALRKAGHEVYDFRHPTPDNNGFAWSDVGVAALAEWAEPYRKALMHPIAETGFFLDFEAMQWADTCVLVLPCGRSAHLEAGWFVGAGKPLYILLEAIVHPELMYKMATALCLNVNELLQELAS